MEEPFGEDAEIDENFFEEEIPEKSKCPKKNIFFFILGIFLLLFIILLSFLLIDVNPPKTKKEETKEIIFSEINCSFYIIDAPKEIQILNENFKNNSNMILKFNGIEQNFSKFIKFEKI